MAASPGGGAHVLTGFRGKASKAETSGPQRGSSQLRREARPLPPDWRPLRGHFCLDFALICCSQQEKDFEIQCETRVLMCFLEGPVPDSLLSLPIPLPLIVIRKREY